jgi:hypothetical protein
MKSIFHKTVFVISSLIALLAAIASAGGIFLKTLYNDNNFVKAAWYTNDIITLTVAVPLLVIAMILSVKGSQHWQLIWIGLLGYMFYNFAFYLFGAAFNIFFLIYTSLFALSAVALILLLSNSDITGLSSKFHEKTPVKWIAIYLLLIAAMLFIAELSMIIPYLISGIIPETIKQTGHPTSVIFALDFSIVIPVSIIAAGFLWKRKAWGYVLGTIMLVKGFTYGLVLCVGTALLAYSKAYGKWDPLMPLYIVLAAGGFLGCLLLLRNMKKVPGKPYPGEASDTCTHL